MAGQLSRLGSSGGRYARRGTKRQPRGWFLVGHAVCEVDAPTLCTTRYGDALYEHAEPFGDLGPDQYGSHAGGKRVSVCAFLAAVHEPAGTCTHAASSTVGRCCP
jgi:hypothetical protein